MSINQFEPIPYKISNTCIGMEKHPHLRLKTLRQLTQLTQEQLARRCVVSYPYILAVETGQRPLTKTLAEKICLATGVGPAWLLGQEGKISKPLTAIGKNYDPSEFLAKRKLALKQDIEPNEDQSNDIHHLCHQLTQLMLAACRKAQFGMGMYFFREMTEKVVNALRLKDVIWNAHLQTLERCLFPFPPDDPTYEEDFDRVERNDLWHLMSPTGSIKWADAFVGTKAERESFTDELDRLRDLVDKSFLSRPPRIAKSSKTQQKA